MSLHQESGQPLTQEHSRPHYWHYGLLALLIAIGASLRFYGLEIQSLWNDELSSCIRSSHSTLREVINLGVRDDVHPPGFQVLLYFVIQWFGTSPTALRASSAVAGTLAIFAVYLLARRAYGKTEGLVAAGLLAVAKCPVYFSQEARSYSWLLLFSTLMGYFWCGIAAYDPREQRKKFARDAAGFVLFAIVASYFHYYGLFLAGLQLFAVLLLSLRKPRKLLIICALGFAVLLGYAPWLKEMLHDLLHGVAWFDKPTLSGPQTFVNLVAFMFNESAPMTYAIIAVWIVYIAGLAFRWTRMPGNREQLRRETYASALLFAWLIVPFTIAYVKSVIGSPVLLFKSLVISVPAAFAFTAAALSWYPNRIVKVVVPSIATAVLGWHLLFDYRYYQRVQKEQFREAAASVVAFNKTSPCEIVLSAYSAEYLNYYFKRMDSPLRAGVMARASSDLADLASFLDSVKQPSVCHVRLNVPVDPRIAAVLDARLAMINTEQRLNVFLRFYNNKRYSSSKAPQCRDPKNVVPGVHFEVSPESAKGEEYGNVRRITGSADLTAPVTINNNVHRLLLRMKPSRTSSSIPEVRVALQGTTESVSLLENHKLKQLEEIEFPLSRPPGDYSLRLRVRYDVRDQPGAVDIHYAILD